MQKILTNEILIPSMPAFTMAMLLVVNSPVAEPEVGPPPETHVETVIDTVHGVAIADPYRWLEDGSSEEVMTWTQAQNEYFQQYVNSFPGREAIADRMTELLQIGGVTTPRVRDSLLFYKKREGDQNHAILYMRRGIDGENEVLLDPNTFSEDGTVALDWWHPSADGSLIAYGVSSSGSERSTLYLLRTQDKSHLPDTIPFTRAVSIAWLPDNSGFYYTRFAVPGTVPGGDEDYYRRVYLHKLGNPWESDPLLFGENLDKAAWTGVQLSPDGSRLFCNVFYGWSRIDFYYKELSQTESEFINITQDAHATYFLTPLDDRFLMVTNYEAERYRLLEGRYEQLEIANWREVIPERESTLESIRVIGNHIVTRWLEDAHSVIVVFTMGGQPIRKLDLPTIGTAGELRGEHDGQDLFFSFASYNLPSTVYRYNVGARELQVFDQVTAGIDVSNIEVEQVWYTSADSTPVSMFVVHHQNIELDGDNPTYLTGYGGFSQTMTPYFSRIFGDWVNHGGLAVVPQLRGGGEYGEAWHNAGKLDKKQNTFDDFIAAAEYLFDAGYTSPERLCIAGGSNGGLLVGAVLVQRPDLCRAVVCSVPLLDMIRYHEFLIARLWISEYGSSEDTEQFEYLYEYSPYHHVEETEYPAVLFKASESDGRVDPMHARKMAARMQAANTSDHPIFLRLETKAGHGQGKPTSKRIEEYTDTWSFIYRELGVHPQEQ